MMVLYALSDVLLALVFEPLMLWVMYRGKRSPSLTRFLAAMKESIRKTAPQFGHPLGPLSLVTIAFGADPMTGRVAAKAAGHGFITGWLIAITGDMIYFSVLMISTLWLSDMLGDGTWTTIIIVALMLVVPRALCRARGRFGKPQSPKEKAWTFPQTR
jgi:hypothetical protein